MQPRAKKLPSNSSFGFVFRMQANGAGSGSNEKTYDIYDTANNFLLGATDDNAPGVTLGWPSDPGDSPNPANRVAPTSRVYDALLSPNNIRLSQVSLVSLRMTHGIRAAVPDFPYLPSSYAYNRDVQAAVQGPINDAIIGDFMGCRRITVQLLRDQTADPANRVGLLVNGLLLSDFVSATIAPQPRLHTFELTNLGAVQVINLSPGVITVGVHVETEL